MEPDLKDKMMKKFTCFLFITVSMIFSGCGSHEALNENSHHEHSEDEHTISVTQWTDTMELFMEFQTPLVSEKTKFIIHLTTLADFKPVTTGAVSLHFRHENGETVDVRTDELSREGIFTPIVQLSQNGTYLFFLKYENDVVNDSFDIGQITVYNSEEDIQENEHDEEHFEVEGISFLKEQQWKIDFQTSSAQFRTIKSSITAVGEVIPHQHGYADIVSPVKGLLKVQHNQNMVVPGSSVKKGDVLAVLCPSFNSDFSWTEWRMNYGRAKSEYERAKRLLQRNAISQRDYEEMERAYLIAQSGYEEFLVGDNVDNSGDLISAENHFRLKSPIQGIISQVSVLAGQNITPGQTLFTIIDPSVVWLKLNVFEKEYYKLGSPQGAAITIPGMNSRVYLEKNHFKLLSKGDFVDKESRTIPILFEITNTDRMFKIGQSLEVDLYTSEEEKSLCVPGNAVYSGNEKVVFVQIEGETFEKRRVKTGDSYNGWIAINEGLSEGEYVVVKGGYQVKLASVNTSIGSPHVH